MISAVVLFRDAVPIVSIIFGAFFAQLIPGLQKIDCNRYSIAMFFSFLSSNTPKSLLFHLSIEYTVFFTFLALISIFFIRFF